MLKRLLLASAALGAIGVGLVVYDRPSQALWMDSPVKGATGGGASFTGVGDALSGALTHFGVIAYSAAQRGHKMLNLCNSAVCADVSSDATTGIVPNTPTINGAPCNNSTHVCTVAAVYDDTGSSNCIGPLPCDMNTTNGGAALTFVTSASGSVPGLKCDGSSQFLTSSGHFIGPYSQPVSTGASYSIPGTPGGTQTVVSTQSTALQGVNSSAQPYGYDGTVLAASSSIATSTFVATTVTNDGAGNGSIETNNGTATTGTIGTTNVPANSDLIYICSDGFSQKFAGTVLEAYIYNVQFTSGNVTALVGKMRTNGGF